MAELNPDLLVASLLVEVLDSSWRRLEKHGCLHKYATLLVCESCLKAHVLDYYGLMLKRNEQRYKCEICGASGDFWLYDLFFPVTATKRLDDAWLENRRKLGLA